MSKKCPYCAEEIPININICPSCGEILHKFNAKIFLIFFIALVVIIIGILGIFLINNSDAVLTKKLKKTVASEEIYRNDITIRTTMKYSEKRLQINSNIQNLYGKCLLAYESYHNRKKFGVPRNTILVTYHFLDKNNVELRQFSLTWADFDNIENSTCSENEKKEERCSGIISKTFDIQPEILKKIKKVNVTISEFLTYNGDEMMNYIVRDMYSHGF